MSTVAAAAARANVKATASRRAFRALERVSLHDTETITAGELAAGDTFVHAGRLWVALSGILASGVMHTRHWHTTEVEHLPIASDDEVLLFV